MVDQTESQERHTQAVERNRIALGRLQDAFGEAAASILQGAPRSFSDASGDLLRQFGGIGRGLASVMAGAEVYVGTWQDLTTRGINFGNQLDTMAISAGQANIKLEDLARIAAENSQVFAQLGYSTNAGINRFLGAQAEFFRATSGETLELRKRLQLLGMTTESINERFLQYDAIANISNMRERRYDDARNRAAAEFAEEMDRLSKLTGEEADRLAAERADISRQGNIFAFSQMVDEQVRDEVAGTVQRLGMMGGTIGDLATDIITRGFPNPDDPAVMALHSFAPELVQTLHGIRAAAQRGDEAEAQRLQELATSQAAALRNNQDVLNMAVLGGANEYTRGLQDVLTDLNKSAEALSFNELQEQFMADNQGRRGSAEELAALRNRLIAEETAAQTNVDETSTSGQRALTTYLDGLRALQQTAAVLQERTIQTIFDGIATASDALAAQVEGFDPAAAADRSLDYVGGMIREYLPTIGMTSQQAAEYATIVEANRRAADLIAAAETLASRGDTEAAEALTAQAEELRNAAGSLGDGTTIDELNQLIGSSVQTINSNSDILVTGRDIILDAERVRSLLESFTPDSGNSTGTLGTTGRLFKDFGRETLTALHGIEAVTTPEQMAAIVENSAMGALRAAQRSYSESNARNSTSSLTGMLNTVRASVSDFSQTGQGTDLQISEIRSAISSLAVEMRGPMEDALNNTLGSSLTQLVDISKENVDMGNRIRKGFSTLSGDYLRGA